MLSFPVAVDQQELRVLLIARPQESAHAEIPVVAIVERVEPAHAAQHVESVRQPNRWISPAVTIDTDDGACVTFCTCFETP